MLAPKIRLRSLALICVTAAAVSTLTSAIPGQASPSTTEVSGLRAVPAASGTSMVTYDVRHRPTSPMTAGDPFDGVRLRRAEHPELEGLWAHGGTAASWAAPSGEFQLDPLGTLIEDIHVTDSLNWESAAPVQPGDDMEVAMGTIPWDAPLPWDRPRGEPDGELGWEASTDVRVARSTYGGQTTAIDVLMFRMDIVARGGDVAAGESMDLPPLWIDLPRQYLEGVAITGASGVAFPYTHYMAGWSFRAYPKLGKALVEASVHGYIPEARSYRLPGGATMKEWHIPLVGVYAFRPTGAPLEARGSLDLPGGGIAQVTTDGVTRDVVVGGSGLRFGEGLPILGAVEATKSSEEAAEAAPPAGSVQIDELAAASVVDHTLAEPVSLTAAGGRYGITLDPNYRGRGVLALRDATRMATGSRYAETIAVPFVTLNGQTYELTTERLTDLRVVPLLLDTVTFTFTYTSNQMPVRNGSPMFQGGFVVDAVYELPGDLRATLSMFAPSAYQNAPSDLIPGSVRSMVSVIDAAGEVVPSIPVHYVELPATGPVSLDGETHETEFSAPLDWRNADHKNLVVGDRTFFATADPAEGWMSRSTEIDGELTVLRGPAPLTPSPEPSPGTRLDGETIALYYRPSAAEPSGHSFLRATITSDGPPPAPSPKPLGTPCGTPQAVDQSLPDAPASHDIIDAWLDADAANVYATMRIRDLPTAAPPQQTIHYTFHWRHDHSGWFARAVLNAAGTWTFDWGPNNGLDFLRFGLATGEVRPGPNGLIRIAVPRTGPGYQSLGYLDGDLLRETSAHALVTAPLMFMEIDAAPHGSGTVYGSGDDYTVGRCD